MLTQEQIERWSTFRNEMFNDDQFMQFQRDRDERRVLVREQMLSFLARYLSGEIDNSQFRADFQQKTATDWDVFGLKGFSGAMFLNMLVNNLPNQIQVAEQLRTVLPIPENEKSGFQRLNGFLDYLKSLLHQGLVAKRRLQPAHAPFFVSAWWHLQNLEEWPVYYVSARRPFGAEGIYSPLSDPIEDYFSFRNTFMAIAEALGVNTWEMEHICTWRDERNIATMQATLDPLELQATGTVTGREVSESSLLDNQEEEGLEKQIDNTHTQIQLLLAKIGTKLGCQVWVATGDRGRAWQGEELGAYSLSELPKYIVADPQAQRIIEAIDILWLTRNRGVAAAFEIEHSTSIFSGLLRMSDLITLQPNISFPLYIVTSAKRIVQVRRQLSRPTFQYLELHRRCGFFSYDELIKEANSIMRWANNPDAIETLAEYVRDVVDR